MRPYDPAFATLGRLYGAESRPPITTLTLWGGFASAVCWPLSAFLVAHVGRRGACLFGAINAMLLDMLAALARKDYDARRRRRAQGQAKSLYNGRAENVARNTGVFNMLQAEASWSSIQDLTECRCATIAKLAKRIREV